MRRILKKIYNEKIEKYLEIQLYLCFTYLIHIFIVNQLENNKYDILESNKIILFLFNYFLLILLINLLLFIIIAFILFIFNNYNLIFNIMIRYLKNIVYYIKFNKKNRENIRVEKILDNMKLSVYSMYNSMYNSINDSINDSIYGNKKSYMQDNSISQKYKYELFNSDEENEKISSDSNISDIIDGFPETPISEQDTEQIISEYDEYNNLDKNQNNDIENPINMSDIDNIENMDNINNYVNYDIDLNNKENNTDLL